MSLNAFICADRPESPAVALPSNAESFEHRDETYVRVAAPDARSSTDRALVAAALASATRVEDFAILSEADAKLLEDSAAQHLRAMPAIAPQEWSTLDRDARPLNLLGAVDVVAWFPDHVLYRVLLANVKGIREPEAFAAVKEVRRIGPMSDPRPELVAIKERLAAEEREKEAARARQEEEERLAGIPDVKSARERRVVAVRVSRASSIKDDALLYRLELPKGEPGIYYLLAPVERPWLADQPGAKLGDIEFLPGDAPVSVLPRVGLRTCNWSPLADEIIREARAGVKDLGPIPEERLTDETTSRGRALVTWLEGSRDVQALVSTFVISTLSYSPIHGEHYAKSLALLAQRYVRGGVALASSLDSIDRLCGAAVERIQRHERERVANAMGPMRAVIRGTRSTYAQENDPNDIMLETGLGTPHLDVRRPSRRDIASALEAALAGGEIAFGEAVDEDAVRALEREDDDREIAIDVAEKMTTIFRAVIGDRRVTSTSEVKGALTAAGLVATWDARANRGLVKLANGEGYSVRMGRPELVEGGKGWPCRCFVRNEEVAA